MKEDREIREIRDLEFNWSVLYISEIFDKIFLCSWKRNYITINYI